MKEQIIHLETHDDVISARERLSRAQAERVLLVFPDDPRQPILQRRLDLVLLQREATRQRADLALITRDPTVNTHAGELGIPVFATVKASHRKHWRTARAQMQISREEQPTPLTSELAAAISTQREPAEVTPTLRRGVGVALFSATLTMVVIAAVFVMPGATVRIEPAANQVAITTAVTADPALQETDTANDLIPARTVGIEVEETETVSTTGTVAVPDTFARGVALFSNQIPEQVTIPAGTIVRTSAAQPVRFRTMADITLAGQVGAAGEVAIEALEPGFAGNLPSARINQIEGPLSNRVAVTNSEATRGGDVLDVAAVSQADRDRVRALLLQQIQQSAYADMLVDPLVNLQETEFIPLETLNVVLVYSEDYDGVVDEPADALTLTMRVVVQGVAIDERLARQVVYADLAERVDAGFRLRGESIVYRRGEIIAANPDSTVAFVMQGAGDVAATIDEERARRMLVGVPKTQARLLLDREFALGSAPEIETWPDFWPLLPLLPLRIQVETTL